MLTGGILSAQTYERVISLLEPNEVNKICMKFSNILTEINKNKKEKYHFDGKLKKEIQEKKEK